MRRVARIICQLAERDVEGVEWLDVGRGVPSQKSSIFSMEICYILVHFHTPWENVQLYNPRFVHRCKYWQWMNFFKPDGKHSFISASGYTPNYSSPNSSPRNNATLQIYTYFDTIINDKLMRISNFKIINKDLKLIVNIEANICSCSSTVTTLINLVLSLQIPTTSKRTATQA